MPMFLIQSAILIAIAFVIGCILGCLLRRWFGANETAVPGAAAITAVAAAPAVKAVPLAPVPAALPEPAPLMAAAVPVVENQETPKAKTAPKAKSSAKPKAAAKPKAVVAAAPAKTPAVKTVGKPLPKPKAGRKPLPAMLAAPIGGKPDNLTLINGIGNVIEKRLHGMGVFHFAQIADWTKAQAENFSKSVGFPGRAEREGWMKEAALFAKGGTTDHARKVEAGAIPTSRKSTTAEKGGAAKPPRKK